MADKEQPSQEDRIRHILRTVGRATTDKQYIVALLGMSMERMEGMIATGEYTPPPIETPPWATHATKIYPTERLFLEALDARADDAATMAFTNPQHARNHAKKDALATARPDRLLGVLGMGSVMNEPEPYRHAGRVVEGLSRQGARKFDPDLEGSLRFFMKERGIIREQLAFGVRNALRGRGLVSGVKFRPGEAAYYRGTSGDPGLWVGNMRTESGKIDDRRFTKHEPQGIDERNYLRRLRQRISK